MAREHLILTDIRPAIRRSMSGGSGQDKRSLLNVRTVIRRVDVPGWKLEHTAVVGQIN